MTLLVAAGARLSDHQDALRQDRARRRHQPDYDVGARHQYRTGVRRRVRARRHCWPGLAGALAVPVRSLVSGMGFSILIESFIVTVIGGMGSVAGALVGALLIGLVRSFGTIGFPLFTEGLMFVFMTIVLIVKPSGLFGKEL